MIGEEKYIFGIRKEMTDWIRNVKKQRSTVLVMLEDD